MKKIKAVVFALAASRDGAQVLLGSLGKTEAMTQKWERINIR